ncbi:unnamed protein product [Paramecium primaurelia]|uniref:Uncharacterized protein n=1 Tax=Paramecium primaurelia TaxID=5886 RepID=A0A8S1MIY1_PARPR|nr:unnamed protein product [Paramecium primaurelia]
MFKQNPILNLFSDDCDISSFFCQNRQLNKLKMQDMVKRTNQGYDQKLKRIIIDCGNKCGIKNLRENKNEITFMKIRNCSIMCKQNVNNELHNIKLRTRNKSVQPQKIDKQFDIGAWTKESWSSV